MTQQQQSRPSNVLEFNGFVVVTRVEISKTTAGITLYPTLLSTFADNTLIQEWFKEIQISESGFQENFPELFEAIKTATREISGITDKSVEFHRLEMKPNNKIIRIEFADSDNAVAEGRINSAMLAGADAFNPVLEKYNELVMNTFQAILGLGAQQDAFLSQYATQRSEVN